MFKNIYMYFFLHHECFFPSKNKATKSSTTGLYV